MIRSVSRAVLAVLLTVTACGEVGGTDQAAHAPATTSPAAPASTEQTERTTDMKIRLILDDATLDATLTDSAAARDFAALLPLTLTLSDYAGNEKVSDLPRKLSTTGAPPEPPPRSETSTTTPPGATWPSSTRTSATPTAWST
jgi:hypothetical protein